MSNYISFMDGIAILPYITLINLPIHEKHCLN
jgi:hypothetical protein